MVRERVWLMDLLTSAAKSSLRSKRRFSLTLSRAFDFSRIPWNDTIVIFDRNRENRRLLRKEDFAALVNKSINQTLSRTILTSGLTFLTVLVLFLMGGQVLRAFSFALWWDCVGTYSSFGIAAPLVVFWHRFRDKTEAAGSGSQPARKPA